MLPGSQGHSIYPLWGWVHTYLVMKSSYLCFLEFDHYVISIWNHYQVFQMRVCPTCKTALPFDAHKTHFNKIQLLLCTIRILRYHFIYLNTIIGVYQIQILYSYLFDTISLSKKHNVLEIFYFQKSFTTCEQYKTTL